jgi:RND family efflux transporter MFP subunit
MKKKIYLLIALAPLAFTNCGGKSDSQLEPTPAISVRVERVGQENRNPWISASGKIEAANSATLSTRMMGYVENIYPKVGQKVSQGQLLVSLNNSELSAKRAQVQASIAEAQAAYNNAAKDYQRFVTLFQENSATQKEVDDITTRMDMAKARLDASQQIKNEVDAQFSYVQIRAPFSGIITNQFIDEGDMATPGAPLISLEGPEAFEAKVAIPESEITKVHQGDTVEVQVKSSGLILTGTVSEVSSSAKDTGGQYLVTITLDPSEKTILSGMYVTVLFPVESVSASKQILVPQNALVTKGQLTGIYTVSQSNTAVLRWIRLGKSFGDKVEVLSGLTADESYIVSASGKLYNGANITLQ